MDVYSSSGLHAGQNIMQKRTAPNDHDCARDSSLTDGSMRVNGMHWLAIDRIRERGFYRVTNRNPEHLMEDRAVKCPVLASDSSSKQPTISLISMRFVMRCYVLRLQERPVGCICFCICQDVACSCPEATDLALFIILYCAKV